MTTHKYNPTAVVSLLFVFNVLTAYGQQPTGTATRSVRPASFDRAAGNAGPVTVEFGRRLSCVGDQVEQAVSLEMRLKTSLRQGNELIEKNQTVVRSHQRRLVTTRQVDQDRVTAVDVRYDEATKQISSDDAAEPSSLIAQSVQGKTYHCLRAAGNDAKLIVTEPDGQVPPPEECEIVEQNMEMVGQANPLAQFLAGRTVAVGETIVLPQQLAERLFNLGDRFGEVTRFELALEKVDRDSKIPCAHFVARVEAASNDSSQMRMEVEGPLVIEIDTCRAVRLALSGPIGMTETRGSYSTLYQLLGTGQLKMSIDSVYRDAK